jgi:hypothetical protein
MLSTFRKCEQRAMREYFQHWKSLSPNVDLHAGKSFAAGLEHARRAFYDHEQPVEAALAIGLKALLEEYGDFDCPQDSPKSAERMAQAFEFYLSGPWALDCDPAKPLLMASGSHAVEFNFIDPLPVNHPQTGEPILYSSRTDMICSLNGGLFIEDDKTTKAIGPKWANKWEMRAQFSGNVWGARNHGWKVDGVLVRGVAILKTEFRRAQHVTYRPPFEIDRWLKSTSKILRRMIACWEQNDWDYEQDETCAMGCKFLPICKKPNPDEWLPAYFTKRKWDPVTRTETPL